MTAEGSTGAPLRQQIAEAIHAQMCETCHQRVYPCDEMDDDDDYHMAADAVVALLNLTEEHALTFAPDMPPAVMERRIADALSTSERPLLVRYVTPWLPSTPPDTTSSEPA